MGLPTPDEAKSTLTKGATVAALLVGALLFFIAAYDACRGPS